MTVGEALAEARTRAGLSVDEVSERTRIREKVIQGIERDDFEACGGDLFVRGYVRVIAGAVGLDAQPLIREYDKSHQSGTLITPVRPAPEAPAPAAAPAVPAAPKLPAAPVELAASAEPAAPEPSGAFEHVKILPAVPAVCPEPAVGEPPADGEPADEGEPAVIDLTRVATPGRELVPLRIQPGPRIHPSLTRHGWRRRIRDRRRELAVVVLAIVVLAAAAIAGARIASSLSAAANVAPLGAAGGGTAAGGATAGRAAKEKAPVLQRDPGRRHAKTARPSPVRRLAVSSAEAFGPGGVANGDNPGSAMNAVRPGAARPWSTHWYASARFGQLKPGTGLLLDMGRAVTVTRVTIDLGAAPGAALKLGAGTRPHTGTATGDLRPVAGAADAGGVVTLRMREPVRARYLLVWFTSLPASVGGRYQASVYHVTVDGRR